jgi:hypothetical protein
VEYMMKFFGGEVHQLGERGSTGGFIVGGGEVWGEFTSSGGGLRGEASLAKS